MSSPKLRRLLLVLAFSAGGEAGATAADELTNVPAPVASAAAPRVTQTALAATSTAKAQVGSMPPGRAPVPGSTGPATLWKFMGIPQGIRKVQGATRNRRGNMPGTEPKPPMKAIADPANLDPNNGPAITTAANIKQQEDLAPQKIKALKYMATIGCSVCYAKKGMSIEDAFAASIDASQECTEEVRYEAAKALKKAIENKCQVCGGTCCCTAEMMTLLDKVATGKDDNGCFYEPSARVREAACEALLACKRQVPVYPAPVAPLLEQEVPPPDIEREIPVPPMREGVEGPTTRRNTTDGDQASNEFIDEILDIETKGGTAASLASMKKSSSQAEAGDRSASYSLVAGLVVGIDANTSTVALEFPGRRQPTVGSHLSLHHDYAMSTSHLGSVEIVYRAGGNRAIARPVGRLDFGRIHKGDRVTGQVRSTPSTSDTATAGSESALSSETDVDLTGSEVNRKGNFLTSWSLGKFPAPQRPSGASWSNAAPAKPDNSTAYEYLPAKRTLVRKSILSKLIGPITDSEDSTGEEVIDPAMDIVRDTASPARSTPGVVLLEE